MRIIFVLLIFLTAHPILGSWKTIYIWEHELNYGTYPRAIDCFDNKNCAAIYRVAQGKQYTLRFTSDVGYSWYTAINDTAYYIKDEQGNVVDEYNAKRLFSLDCVSEKFSIAGSDSGRYYISRDGLKNWKEYYHEDSIDIYDVHFFNDEIGLVLSGWLIDQNPPYPYQNYISITNDGAETWFELTPDFSDLDSNTYIDAVAWASEEILYLSAYNAAKDRSIILKSTNQGKDFGRIKELKERVSCLYFINENIGFAGGGNQVSKKGTYMKNIYKTYDGGHNWETKVFDFIKPYTSSIKEIKFSDSLNGIAWPYSTQLYETTDGGETWIIDTSYNMPYFCYDMHMFGKNDIIGCGFLSGHIWRKDPTTSIMQTDEIIGEIKIYPNPIPRGWAATISLDIDHPGMYSFSVYSIDGRLVDSYQAFLHTAENTIEYQPENLPTGNYFLVISGGGGDASVKLVVD